MALFSNPNRSSDFRGSRRQSARFAPEILQRRLSPSDLGLTPGALVQSSSLDGSGGTPPGGGTELPPPPGNGEVPSIPPSFPYGPWDPY